MRGYLGGNEENYSKRIRYKVSFQWGFWREEEIRTPDTVIILILYNWEVYYYELPFK